MKQILIFWLGLGQLAVLKISESKLKYATFEGSFLNVFMGQTNLKKILSGHCGVCTTKLHNLKVRKP
jgi:hypothetical protein